MPDKTKVPKWAKRAMDPKTPETSSGSTVRSASSYSHAFGGEIVYPTIRMNEHGQLYSPVDPLGEAFKQNDFMLIKGPPNAETAARATAYSKELSRQIGKARRAKPK